MCILIVVLLYVGDLVFNYLFNLIFNKLGIYWFWFSYMFIVVVINFEKKKEFFKI